MGTFFYDLNKRLNELAAPKETLNEGVSATDYKPKSQGGTRKELTAKYHKTRDPQDAAAARRAGATQKELKGVAEGSCGSMGEAGYSAKAARAGRDIGRPGKQFAKIAKGAAERYGSEERGEAVAGAVLKKLRAKESVEDVEEGIKDKLRAMNYDRLARRTMKQADDHLFKTLDSDLDFASDERIDRDEEWSQLYDKSRNRKAKAKQLRAMDEEQLDEFFHFDLPPGKDRGPRDHGTDELARRAEVSKRTKRPIAMDPSYKDKDQYGDMYKIAGPKGRLPEADMGEEQLDELFHFDLPPGKDRGPRDHGTDELARRAEVSKRTKRPIAMDPSYKDKDQYGDMYKIAGPKGRLPEADMGEGNEFSGALAQARKTGSATFRVDGKTYKVTEAELDEANKETKKDFKARQERLAAASAQTAKDPVRLAKLSKIPGYTAAMDLAKKTTQKEEAELDEREFDSKEKFDRGAQPGDTYRGHRGTITKTRSGETHRRRDEEEPDVEQDDSDSDAPKTKGRPRGTRRAIGAKGPTGRSKLLKKDSIKETEVEEDYDRDEYDEEGEMAKSQSRTIADAAMELQDMLGDNENLPEWVQKKINLAMDYIDAVRDYLKANRPEDDMVAEKAVSRAQRAAAGIARAAQKGDIPQSKLRGASKAMAKMPAGELKKFAKTKEKGLPEKKTSGKKKEVEETTVSGSVAPSAESPKKSKAGMQYGKGIYDSFDRAVENLIAESMNVSMNVSSEGQRSVTVTATDEDAAKLASLLKMAGIGGAMGSDDHACPSCGGSPCGCAEQVDENQPDWPTNTETSADALQYSGGLNRPKSTGQTTAPIVASQIDRVEPEDDEDDLARLREMAGISEAAKPDFLDVDKDGDKKEPMKKAAKEKEHDDEEVKESILDMTRLWKAYQG